MFSNELRLRSIEEQLDGLRDDMRQLRSEHHEDSQTINAKLDSLLAHPTKVDTAKTVGGVSALSLVVSAIISGIVSGVVPKGGS